MSKALEVAKSPIIGEVVLPPTDEEMATHVKYVKEIVALTHSMAQNSLDIWHRVQWIHDHKTWRNEHKTFNDFCRDELGKDNSQIYRLMRDAEFKETLLLQARTDEERLSVANLKESNSRYLRKLPKEVQIAMWQLAYGIAPLAGLPKKADGSVEMTTGYLESVGAQIESIVDSGVLNIDGEAVPIDAAKQIAEASGVDEDTAKAVLMAAGVSEEYVEKLNRQKQHIKDKSMKADFINLRGTIESRVDINGSQYPVIVDSKGQEVDVADVVLSFVNRFGSLSFKFPIRD